MFYLVNHQKSPASIIHADRMLWWSKPHEYEKTGDISLYWCYKIPVCTCVVVDCTNIRKEEPRCERMSCISTEESGNSGKIFKARSKQKSGNSGKMSGHDVNRHLHQCLAKIWHLNMVVSFTCTRIYIGVC